MIARYIQEAERELQPLFVQMEEIAQYNQNKVVRAFQKNQIAFFNVGHIASSKFKADNSLVAVSNVGF